MICVAVTYVIRPGHELDALEHFRALIPATRAEPGCRTYLVHRSTTNPRQFFLYEQYDDQAALDAHRAAPHFERHVKNGLFAILETRAPELYELIDDGA
jgi:quinol monooxygenase YgiN